MKRPSPPLVAAALFAVATGCAPVRAQPARAAAAPAATSPTATSPTATSPAASAPTAADVRFVRGMIAHHAQALAMTALVPARTARPDLRLLAERIEVSQRDEIAMMRRWLEDRGVAAAGADSAHAAHAQDHAEHHAQHQAQPHGAGGHAAHAAMPGMLTAAELARLAGARGAEFERLFLESMVRHHEGALTMVADLLAAPGAAQDSQLFGIASDVDADQRAEIARMRALLGALATPPSSTSAPSSAPR